MLNVWGLLHMLNDFVDLVIITWSQLVLCMMRELKFDMYRLGVICYGAHWFWIWIFVILHGVACLSVDWHLMIWSSVVLWLLCYLCLWLCHFWVLWVWSFVKYLCILVVSGIILDLRCLTGKHHKNDPFMVSVMATNGRNGIWLATSYLKWPA